MPYTEAYREHIMYMFNGFCKTVIRFAAINAWRDRSRRRKKEISANSGLRGVVGSRGRNIAAALVKSQLAARKVLTEANTEEAVTLYTRDKAVMRKLDTLIVDFPDIYKLIGQDEVSKTYSFPKSYVSYYKPRAISAEQREQARQMMIERNRGKKIKDFLWKCERIYDNMI